jgi:hypothetical protein
LIVTYLDLLMSDVHFTYHGSDLELMGWNLRVLGDAETRLLHKDNVTYNKWLDEQEAALDFYIESDPWE